jgi:GTPase SAR1 family protein
VKQIDVHADPNIKKILLGNKSDSPGRVVSRAEGEALAQRYNLPFFETSAKTGENVNDAIMAITQNIVGSQEFANLEESYRLRYAAETERKRQKCCGK